MTQLAILNLYVLYLKDTLVQGLSIHSRMLSHYNLRMSLVTPLLVSSHMAQLLCHLALARFYLCPLGHLPAQNILDAPIEPHFSCKSILRKKLKRIAILQQSNPLQWLLTRALAFFYRVNFVQRQYSILHLLKVFYISSKLQRANPFANFSITLTCIAISIGMTWFCKSCKSRL